MLLDHQRRLATDLEIVVGVGAGAGGIDNGISLAQHLGRQCSATDPSLGMSDGNTALELKQQSPIPLVGRRGLGGVTQGSQRGEAVQEAIQGSALPAHDKIDFTAVSQGRGRHVSRAAAIAG